MEDCVRRILAVMFTDKFGMELSWEGRNKKVPMQKTESFRLIAGKQLFTTYFYYVILIMFILILASIQANPKYSQANIADIEEACKNWIYFSRRRFNRSEEKNSSGGSAGAEEVDDEAVTPRGSTHNPKTKSKK